MSAAALTPVFANAAGELLAHPAGYAVLRYQAGAADVAAFTDLLTQAGAVLAARRWDHLLSNALHLPPLSAEAKEWTIKHWLGGRIPRPHTVHVALVQPAAVLARLSASEVQMQAQGGTRYYPFATEAEAHAFVATRLA